MSKSFGPIPFIGLFLFIGLPMAFLSNEPDHKCLELIGSPRFGKMIGKLQREVPIEKSTYQGDKIWDKDGTVNYSVLLPAMKGFMAELEKHKKSKYQEFVQILGQKCGTKYLILSITCEKVLNEALECAVEVHKFIEHQKEQETGDKLAKEEIWSTVDKNFAKDLKTIWVLYEPVEIYVECHGLPESTDFTKMIGKLKNKIPIHKGDGNIGILDAKSHQQMNYHQVLFAINHFSSEMKEEKKYTKWAYAVTTSKTAQNRMSYLEQEGRDFVEMINGQRTGRRFQIDSGYALVGDKFSQAVQSQNNDVRFLVEYVLDKALKCANRVREFTENLETLVKKGDYAKEPKNNWTVVEKKFEAGLKKIFEADSSG